jgi:general secretion pathway protein H
MPGLRQRGFSLLEILVVLALAVLMYALVPPLFSATGGAELRAAARQLAAGLRKTRVQAIAGRKEAVLSVDLEAKRFQAGDGGRAIALPQSAEVSVFTAKSEVVEGRQAAIRFFPDGSSTGGAITVSGAGTRYRVDVDWLTGNVVIRE